MRPVTRRLVPLAMALCMAGALAGQALASAGPRSPAPAPASDFNGDGFADLAVGAPAEDIGTKEDAGSVSVLFGAADGVSAGGDQIWYQDAAGVIGTSEANDRFGAALASGDFDDDGAADLAIGAPFEDLGDADAAGAVNVLTGSPAGLSSDGNQLWTQDSTAIPDGAEAGDQFGSALAAGDFDADGYDDLAIGAPGENWEPGHADAGVVHVLYGSAAGLTATGTQLWRQGGDGLTEQPESGDGFGTALAAANFGRGRAEDLAVGVPFESYGCGFACAHDAVGLVQVVYGSAGGLTSAGTGVLRQGDPVGFEDEGEAFGFALAAGNFGKSRLNDLAAGVPGDGVGQMNHGSIRVMYGASSGLTSGGAQTLTRPGSVGSGDEFGSALATGNMGGTLQAELAAAAPFAKAGDVAGAGVVAVFPGSADGLTGTGVRTWSQASAGVAGDPGSGDWFGRALQVAEFGRDPKADLAIGVPGEVVGGDGGAGAVQVLYGTPGGVVATGSQLLSQDTPGVAGTGEPGDRLGCSLTGTPSRRCS